MELVSGLGMTKNMVRIRIKDKGIRPIFECFFKARKGIVNAVIKYCFVTILQVLVLPFKYGRLIYNFCGRDDIFLQIFRGFR